MHTPTPNIRQTLTDTHLQNKTALDTELTAAQLNKRPRSTDTDKNHSTKTQNQKESRPASIERRDDGITLRGRL